MNIIKLIRDKISVNEFIIKEIRANNITVEDRTVVIMKLEHTNEALGDLLKEIILGLEEEIYNTN